jgi:DNA-binding transcriptional LysR family regulator
MDLRQIMYFMCVYEEASFTKAARRLGVVQPALSIQVRRLEDEFGMALFDRNAKGLVPTASGKLFYELCAPIRRNVGEARQQMLELAKPDQVFGAVRCGFPPAFFKSLLAPVLIRFAERYPRVELTVREGYGGTLKEWVARGELDFAFGAWFDDQSIEHSVVYEEELAFVSGAPIAGKPFHPCDLSRIEGLKLLLPSSNQMLGPVLRQHIAAGLLHPVRTMTVDSYLGVLEVARASDWAALIPITGLLDEASNPDIFIYPIARPYLSFRWHLLHEQAQPLSTAAQILVEAVAAELAEKHSLWRALWEGRIAEAGGASGT